MPLIVVLFWQQILLLRLMDKQTAAPHHFKALFKHQKKSNTFPVNHVYDQQIHEFETFPHYHDTSQTHKTLKNTFSVRTFMQYSIFPNILTPLFTKKCLS